MSEQPDRSRVDHLRDMVNDLQARMAVCDSDQNFAVMGRLRADLLKQIDEAGGEQKPKETGLSDFEKRLRDRQAGAKTSRRAQSR